ncbi:hypothetical protein ILUMI_17131 [Ignelater luminosus]|uniref:Uncharacterized protein n=1 Tax=Ignelater luminosus TaxID=2038154 RepID=A0A8K0CRK9_IGNLU|nr:hypothetical protein ILUMI_17131 [Ignelater luminosus]
MERLKIDVLVSTAAVGGNAGVGIILSKKFERRAKGYIQHNERGIMFKLIKIIQAYMPTTDHDDEQVGETKKKRKRNRLIEFCATYELVVANTLFQHHARKRYTSTMPANRGRHQIDYILTKQRFKNQIKDCKSYPEADIDNDHNLVMMESNLKFKRL